MKVEEIPFSLLTLVCVLVYMSVAVFFSRSARSFAMRVSLYLISNCLDTVVYFLSSTLASCHTVQQCF